MSEHKLNRTKTDKEKALWEYRKRDLLVLKGTKKKPKKLLRKKKFVNFKKQGVLL